MNEKLLVNQGVHLATNSFKKISVGGPKSVRFLGFCGAVGTGTQAFFSLISDIVLPIGIVIDGYVFIACLFAIILEVSTTCKCCTLKLALKLEYWAKFLSRGWGNSLLYLFIGGIGLAKWSLFWIISGSYMCSVAVIYMIVSIRSSKKLNQIQRQASEAFDDDWERTFQEFDKDNDGWLDPDELQAMAAQYNSSLSINELHTILNYLDADRDGKISMAEFKCWWKQNKLTYI